MPPVTLLIKPASGLCQMRCRYCFYADEMRSRGTGIYAPMTLETLEKLVRRAFQFADGGVHFAFQGGEPTLAGAEFYEALLAFEKRYNTRGLQVSHSLQTNGFVMTAGMLEILKKGRFLCGLSLDGTQTLHDRFRLSVDGEGTWERGIHTARAFQEKEIPFNILCVVDEGVAKNAEQVLQTLLPFRYLQFIPRLDPLDGRTDENSLTPQSYGRFLIEAYRLYASELHAGRFISIRALDNYMMMLMGRAPDSCAFQGRCAPNFVIESDGSVYPCDFFALDEYKMGNVHADSFYKMAVSSVQKNFLVSDPVPEDCRGCPYFALCRNGCRRERIQGKTWLCEGMKLFFETCLQDMQSLIASGALSKIREPEKPVF